MKNLNKSLLILLFITISVIVAYMSIFRTPNTAQLHISQGGSHKNIASKRMLQCYDNEKAKPIDNKGELKILVWNIFKQSKKNWRDTLVYYSKESRLALLQEVSLTNEFKAYRQKSEWFTSHVNAFSVLGLSTGVSTLSTNSPVRACAHIEYEPWIQLPKSGIYSIFKLSDNRKLVVVNLHAVNFTYGIKEYEKQINALVTALKKHKGPVIFAGDLNTWSLERINSVKTILDELNLIEVKFTPDNRKRFINGMVLDYVFYRELQLVNAQSPITDASDHNPLLVTFRL